MANHDSAQPVQSPLNTDPGTISKEPPALVNSSAAKVREFDTRKVVHLPVVET